MGSMSDEEFNLYCAEVMDIDIDDDFIADYVDDCGGGCYLYNPADDLNQMADVV